MSGRKLTGTGVVGRYVQCGCGARVFQTKWADGYREDPTTLKCDACKARG